MTSFGANRYAAAIRNSVLNNIFILCFLLIAVNALDKNRITRGSRLVNCKHHNDSKNRQLTTDKKIGLLTDFCYTVGRKKSIMMIPTLME